MPRRASLFGYCAMVRTPLRLPTTDVATPPTFEPRQPPLVSWHFFLLAPQVSVPICADHCLLQKAPECNAPYVSAICVPTPFTCLSKDTSGYTSLAIFSIRSSYSLMRSFSDSISLSNGSRTSRKMQRPAPGSPAACHTWAAVDHKTSPTRVQSKR